MPPVPPAPIFADSYADARRLFLDASRDAGAMLTEIRNPRGAAPDGGGLYADLAWVGPLDSERVLFCVSGTHGIEGYAGSAIQTALLRHGVAFPLPERTALLLLHGLNPFGFAYFRRVNEDNIDVNRNFIDHAHPPRNERYPDLHDALVPKEWSGPRRAEADQWLGAYAAHHGRRALQAAVTGGQWTHPDGLFYGGTAPCWSHRVLRDVASSSLARAAHVGYIDLHTGLGERGVGEPIFRGGRDPEAMARARRWYGSALTVSEDGTSSSTPITGNTATAVADALGPGQLLTAITLEFGTLDGGQVLTALRGDNWRHVFAPDDRETADSRTAASEIRARMIDAFCPADRAWRDRVWRRAAEVFWQALRGVTR